MRLRLVAMALAAAAGLGAAPTQAVQTAPLGIGRTASAADVAAWDVDVTRDGAGLPAGSGTASDGARIFAAQCARCHAGGSGLARIRTSWPYATSLFDYIRRAMPPNRAKPLAAGEVYALTAYILLKSRVLQENASLDARTLPAIAMPGKAAFRDAGGAPLP